MGNFRLDHSDDTNILEIEGDLTIAHVTEFKEILIEAFNTTDHVILDLEKVSTLDLACIQLLCAAHKYSIKTQKHISFKGELPKKVLEVIFDVAIKDTSCDLDFNDHCLWEFGGKDG